MIITPVESADAGRWDDFVNAQPGASIYHRYAWRTFFSDYFGKQTVYLAAQDSTANIVGVLPLVRLKSMIFGDFLISLPFVNYGGIVSSSAAATEALVNEAAVVANDLGASHVEFRHSTPDLTLACRDEKVSMLLQLPDTPEDLGKSIGSKRRSQIRRPLREDPVIRFGGAELVDDFYVVFSRNMRDLGTPVYAKSMFHYLLERFPKESLIATIHVHDKPAAAAFLIFDQNRMEIPWASTCREFNRISINMLLYWEVLSRAIEMGLEEFDFGRSTRDSGTYKFKKQWGATEQPMHWYYWLAAGNELPQINPDNPKYRLAVNTWQKLPVAIANLIGPGIVRNIP